MFLILDTETTGKLPKGATFRDTHLTPRIIQISWRVVDIEFKVISDHTYLIKPDGWEVPSVEMFMIQGMSAEKAQKEAKFWIDNGFTQKQNEEEGLPIEEVFKILIKDMDLCNFFVAHNINFDYPVLASEMYRYKVKATRKPLKICTMLSTVGYVKKPAKFGGGYKWPTLTELHQMLFGKGFDDAHDASSDVSATLACFERCVRLTVIFLPVRTNPTEIIYVKYKDYKDSYYLNLERSKNKASEENTSQHD